MYVCSSRIRVPAKVALKTASSAEMCQIKGKPSMIGRVSEKCMYVYVCMYVCMYGIYVD